MNSNLQEWIKRVRVVLARPVHPGNVGAAARAMKTMGFTDLCLVAPECEIDGQARAMSSNALDVLRSARRFDSLGDALHGTVLVAALTSRKREYTAPVKCLRDAADEIKSAAQQGDVALVFGNETYGLSNEELTHCGLPIMIPANPDYCSLNLAAAVQVVCYELRSAFIVPEIVEKEVKLASFEEVQGLYAHLERALIHSNFLDPENPRRLMPRLRRLFDRARLESDEVNILRGICKILETEK